MYCIAWSQFWKKLPLLGTLCQAQWFFSLLHVDVPSCVRSIGSQSFCLLWFTDSSDIPDGQALHTASVELTALGY